MFDNPSFLLTGVVSLSGCGCLSSSTSGPALQLKHEPVRLKPERNAGPARSALTDSNPIVH